MAPTSTAIPNPKDWADEAMLIPHEGLRLIMSRVQDALGVAAKKDNKFDSATAFFKYFKTYFLPIIHEHHDNEEDIFFPWLAKKAKLEAKLTADHKTLISKMDEISALGEQFSKLPKNPQAKEVNEIFSSAKTKFESLKKMMCEHLAEEEEQVPNVLRTHFTEKEADVIVQKIVKKGGLKGNKMFVPVIYEAMQSWKGPEAASEFKSKVPFPLRVLWWLDWSPAYEKKHKSLVKGIEGI